MPTHSGERGKVKELENAKYVHINVKWIEQMENMEDASAMIK